MYICQLTDDLIHLVSENEALNKRARAAEHDLKALQDRYARVHEELEMKSKTIQQFVLRDHAAKLQPEDQGPIQKPSVRMLVDSLPIFYLTCIQGLQHEYPLQCFSNSEDGSCQALKHQCQTPEAGRGACETLIFFINFCEIGDKIAHSESGITGVDNQDE